MKIILLALLVAGGALAQRHKVNINTETPEGQALQQIGQETDDAKKLAAYEKFTQDYPKSENLAWVYGELGDMVTARARLAAAMAERAPTLGLARSTPFRCFAAEPTYIGILKRLAG